MNVDDREIERIANISARVTQNIQNDRWAEKEVEAISCNSDHCFDSKLLTISRHPGRASLKPGEGVDASLMPVAISNSVIYENEYLVSRGVRPLALVGTSLR